MNPGRGSTVVPEESRHWFERRFGARYIVVEEGAHGVGMNRKARRAAMRARKR